MMKKWIAVLLVCMVLMNLLIPIANAEVYKFSGIYIDVPSDKNSEAIDDESIIVEIDFFSQAMITVAPLDTVGLNSSVFSIMGEDIFLEYLLSQYIEMYPQCEGEITTLANRKCCTIITTMEEYDTEFNVGIAASFIGDYMVEIRYFGLAEISGQEIPLDRDDLERIMSWISENEEQSDADSSKELLSGDSLGQTEEYKFNKGSFILHLNENNYNIFTNNNDENSLSLSRTGYTKSQMDLYVGMSDQDLFILPLGAKDTKFSIKVRVKEDKYPEVGSFLSLSEFEWNLQAKSLVTGFGESDYEMVEKDDVRYCVFDCFSGLSYQRRYATIHNGSMIYIYASRDGEELSEEDIRLLQEIVDAAEFV